MADSIFTQMGSVISTKIDGVQSNVDAEETRALAAEASLQTSLNDEITRATAAEATLQTNIDNVDVGDQSLNTTDAVSFLSVNGRDVAADGANIDAILSSSQADKDSFAEIVTLINSVDIENDTAFAGYVSTNDARSTTIETSITTETTNRTTADTTLQTNIDVVASDLQTNIDSAGTVGSLIYVADDATTVIAALGGFGTGSTNLAQGDHGHADMVGDSGSGGTAGLVPAPAIGDATKALLGDGTWGDVSLTLVTEDTVNDRVGILTDSPAGSFHVIGSLLTHSSQTAAMTDYSLPEHVVTRSHDAYGPAWKAFDGNTNTYWYPTSGPPWWITYQFTDRYRVISEYSLRSWSGALQERHAPKTWTLEGSLNNIDWTVLDSHTDDPFTSGGQTRTFTISNPATYLYYKLNITATISNTLILNEITYNGTTDPGNLVFDSSGNLAVGHTSPTEKLHVFGNVKIEGAVTITDDLTVDSNTLQLDAVNNRLSFFGEVGVNVADPVGPFQVVGTVFTHSSQTAAMTDYSLPEHVVTRSHDAYGPAWKAFDGNTNTYWYPTSGPPWWITYQFTDRYRVISEYSLRSWSGALQERHAPKTWTLEGSLNNIDWTVLDSHTDDPFTSGGQTRTFTISNPATYLYYKLNITATISNTLILNEITYIGVPLSDSLIVDTSGNVVIGNKTTADEKLDVVGNIVATGTIIGSNIVDMVGDSGSGGTAGLVPAPATGDAVANKYLKADATWTTLVDGTKVYSGTSDPSDVTGVDGDYYLQTADGTSYLTGDWFVKSGGTWGAATVNFKGTTGTTGTAGSHGSYWFTGTDSPVVTPPPGPPTPVDGDFYLRSDGQVWSLVSSTWTDISINLKGNIGDTGATGSAGTDGTDGTDGARWYVSNGVAPNSDVLSPASPTPVAGDKCVDTAGYVWNYSGTWVVSTVNLTGPAGPGGGTGGGDVYAPGGGTGNSGVIAEFANADGTLLASTSLLKGNVSQVNVAETRTASINMGDNVFQRPEMKDWAETATTTPTSTGTVVLDMALGNVFKTTLTGNVTTLTINNPPADTKSGTVTWIVTQDASARSIALPTGGVWNGGDTPDFSTPGAVYVITYRTTNAGANWVVFAGGGSVFGLTEGQIVFAGVDGKVAQDAGLFWDNTNKRMGIKTNAPANILDVNLEAGVEVNVTMQATGRHNPHPAFPSGNLESMRDGSFGAASPVSQRGYPTNYAGYYFPAPLYFSKVRFYSASAGNDSRIKTFRILGYTGGAWEIIPITAWLEGCSQYNITEGHATNVDGWKTVEIEPSSCTGIGVYCISAWGSAWSLSEMEAFAVPGSTNILDCTDMGLVGIATGSPECRLHINNIDDSLSLKVLRAGTTATASIAEFTSNVGGSGTVVAKIMVDGDLENTNGVYGSISDIKLKENIVPATPKLEELLQINVCNYNFKNLPDFKQLGVIAQELELIFPCLIKNTPDTKTIKDPNWVARPSQTEENRPWIVVDLGTTTKSVKYSIFVPMLIKALQEFHEKHTTLESRVQALEQLLIPS